MPGPAQLLQCSISRREFPTWTDTGRCWTHTHLVSKFQGQASPERGAACQNHPLSAQTQGSLTTVASGYQAGTLQCCTPVGENATHWHLGQTASIRRVSPPLAKASRAGRKLSRRGQMEFGGATIDLVTLSVAVALCAPLVIRALRKETRRCHLAGLVWMATRKGYWGHAANNA